MSQTSDGRWQAHHFFYHGDLDAPLRHFVRPALAELLGQRLIDGFFFVRYALGGPHVRLRYHLRDRPAGAGAAVDRILERAAVRFLQSWRSETRLDPAAIREGSRAILAAVPEESELYYENNTLLPFAFSPEVERYGGDGLFDLSLDFFVVSSAVALEAIRHSSWHSTGKRGATVFRLLLRQACGFARSEKELLLHLGYRLPLAEELADAIWSKADRDFEARRESYRLLLRHELGLLAELADSTGEPTWPSTAFLPVAAKRLSQAMREEPRGRRWQIGHSQMHMTANRLGFLPPQEMHLQRILWRAVRDLAESEPALWRRLVDALVGGVDAPCPSLHCLREQVTRALVGVDRRRGGGRSTRVLQQDADTPMEERR